MKRISFLIALASLMMFPWGLAHGGIVLDGDVPSTGHYGGDTVIMNSLVTFTFRLEQDAPCTLVAFTNGFEVYTTQSVADPTTAGYFDAIVGDTLTIPGGWYYHPIFLPNGHFDDIFISLYSNDGKGKDTIGFGGLWLTGNAPGFPVGWSENVWYVTTTAYNNGDTLCVDSAWFRPSNDWIWSMMPICTVGNDTIQSITPSFGGPYCFHVHDTAAVVNNPPVIDPLADTTIDEGQNLTFLVTASDPDSDPITLTVDTLQAYFTDNGNGTGTFDWTPSYEDAGIYTLTFVASDGELVDSEVVQITVNNVNRPPVLDSIGSQFVNENENLNFQVTASDPDGDPLTLTVDTLIPYFTDHGNDTGTFDWTPSYEDSGKYSVTFVASDGALADSEVIQITVNNVNRPPDIDPIADTTIIDEGDSLAMVFTAIDPDGDNVSFALDTVYNNMDFTDDDISTALLIFKPDYTQAGSYPLTLYATDGIDTSAASFVIIVEQSYLLDVEPDTLKFLGVAGSPIPKKDTFRVNEIGGGAINYLLAESTPWFSLDSTSGTTPEDVEVSVDLSSLTDGFYFDSIEVTSGMATNSAIYEYISLTVSPAENNPPVLDPIGPQVVNENENLNFQVTASDPDGDPLTIEIDTLYPGMSFTYPDPGNDTGTFDWTPTYDQAGVYNVTFIASDGALIDTEQVEITVNNVNRPPLIDPIADTIVIDECDTLVLTVTATDADGDSIVLAMDTLYDNMTFFDSGNGTAVFRFTPSFDQAGTYPLNVLATDEVDTVSEFFAIIVEECLPPPECVDMILSDTVFHFVDTIDNGGPMLFDTLTITSSGDEFCFFIWCDTDSYWIAHPDSGCTPAEVEISVDPTGFEAGQYIGYCWVSGDTTVCEPSTQMFTVVLDVIDTAVVCDTLAVATVPAVPGAQVVVPVEFRNCCDLSGIAVWLDWVSSDIQLDSITFADSRVADFPIKFETIDNGLTTVLIGAVNDGTVSDVLPGSGNFVNMYFSIDVEAQHGFYEINLYSDYPIDTLPYNPVFVEDCGEGLDVIVPTFITGGIVVDTSVNYVCGYVVDTAGNPIPGATVELWADFPLGSPESTTVTNVSGAFAFSDFTTVPFDLWAYHEGYYPALEENLNFGESGIMLVLTPVEPPHEYIELVNFYCDFNTFMGGPLPVGSVVDAYDPDGIHCGSYFVTEVGKYGFMSVYRDDPYPPHDTTDDGAEPGDTIRFFVNGIEAIATGNTVWTESGDSWEVCLEAGLIVTKYCDLMEGWNLVSWNVDHESNYILDVLQSIDTCLELVMGFEQGGLTYDPDLPEFSTLWYVDHLSGYWIKTSCPVTLEITGAPVPATTPIPVTAGWNLVSYLPDFALTTEDALASLLDNDNLIVALGFDGEGLIYLPNGNDYNTLDTMGPCFGYWLKVWADDDLVYPGVGPIIASSQKGQHPVSLASTATDLTPTSHWINLYGRNLTLDGKTVPAGATVTAHALDGTKIGSFTLNQDGLFGFMPVYADDPATSEIEGIKAGERFYLAIDGNATNENFVWTQTGDKIEVESLTAKAGSDQVLPDGYSLHQNYPNPFNPTTTISFTLPVSGKAKVEIFNILGALVATPFDGVAQAGTNEVVWDGRNSAGEIVSSGIYLYRLTADKYTETKKMTMLK